MRLHARACEHESVRTRAHERARTHTAETQLQLHETYFNSQVQRVDKKPEQEATDHDVEKEHFAGGTATRNHHTHHAEANTHGLIYQPARE